MKQLRAWILLLFTLLLTITGALLPYGVSRLQDTYVENRMETRSFDPVSLTLQQGGDVLVRLRDLSGGFDSMVWSGETKMTPEEVSSAAADVVYILADAGYIPDFFEDRSAGPAYMEPNLIISTERAGSPSAVIWLCSLPGGMVFIDDESGKMVALEAPSPDIYEEFIMNSSANAAVSGRQNAFISDSQMDRFTKLASKWASTLSQYYGMEVSLNEAELPTEYSAVFQLRFQPPEDQEPCDITLTFYDNGHIFFNL